MRSSTVGAATTSFRGARPSRIRAPKKQIACLSVVVSHKTCAIPVVVLALPHRQDLVELSRDVPMSRKHGRTPPVLTDYSPLLKVCP
jgi:hypothetical protein